MASKLRSRQAKKTPPAQPQRSSLRNLQSGSNKNGAQNHISENEILEAMKNSYIMIGYQNQRIKCLESRLERQMPRHLKLKLNQMGKIILLLLRLWQETISISNFDENDDPDDKELIESGKNSRLIEVLQSLTEREILGSHLKEVISPLRMPSPSKPDVRKSARRASAGGKKASSGSRRKASESPPMSEANDVLPFAALVKQKSRTKKRKNEETVKSPPVYSLESNEDDSISSSSEKHDETRNVQKLRQFRQKRGNSSSGQTSVNGDVCSPLGQPKNAASKKKTKKSSKKKLPKKAKNSDSAISAEKEVKQENISDDEPPVIEKQNHVTYTVRSTDDNKKIILTNTSAKKLKCKISAPEPPVIKSRTPSVECTKFRGEPKVVLTDIMRSSEYKLDRTVLNCKKERPEGESMNHESDPEFKVKADATDEALPVSNVEVNEIVHALDKTLASPVSEMPDIDATPFVETNMVAANAGKEPDTEVEMPILSLPFGEDWSEGCTF